VPFGRSAIAPYIRVVPVASQIGIENGAASWDTGFVPLNMTLKTAGGVAPFGSDTNGVLNYISANLVWLMGGGGVKFNADFVTNWTGYPVGAILQSAVDLKTFFYNSLANNPNDPDSVTTGWIPFYPLGNPTGLAASSPAPGTYNDVVVAATTGFVDVDTTGGDVTFTGMTAGANGQLVKVSNTGPNLLNLNSLDGGSLAANQYRLPASLSFTQYGGQSFRYSTVAALWIPV
jgi:hypothetical protein